MRSPSVILRLFQRNSNSDRIAWKVFAADFVERTHNATLQKAKETFRSVHMGNAAVLVVMRVIFDRVINYVMALELFVKANVNASLVRINHRFLCSAFTQSNLERASRNVSNNPGANLATALHQRNNRGMPFILRRVVAFAANRRFRRFPPCP